MIKRMAVFKKSIPVAAHSLHCLPQEDLMVGDVVTFNPADKKLNLLKPATTGTTEVAYATALQTAIKAGLEIYLVSQGDNVTYGIPTEYKNYKVSQVVKASTADEKIVTAYRVEFETDIEFTGNARGVYTLTYVQDPDHNYGTIPSDARITEGTVLTTQIAALTASGHVFDGYYADADFTTKLVENVSVFAPETGFDFSSSDNKVKVYAKWAS